MTPDRRVSVDVDNGVNPSQAPDDNEQITRKARMLVSILGADFAKNSQHPFFRRLAAAAARPVGSNAASGEISAALKHLMHSLSKDETAVGAQADGAKSEKPVQSGPTKAGDPQQTERSLSGASRREEKPHSRASQPVEPQRHVTEYSREHPAIIAQRISVLSPSEKASALENMPGRSARQVAMYLKEFHPAKK